MPLLNGSVRARVSPAEIDVTERLSTLVPPQNLEAEESVLGAMLLSATAVGTVSEILGAADFYRESHAKAYRAACSGRRRAGRRDHPRRRARRAW